MTDKSSKFSLLDLPRRQKLTIYFAVIAALFMSALDVHIVATALPTIASELGDLQLFGWVTAGYVLSTAVVTPFYGKLADIYGTKRIFIVAISIFTVGSLACGLAWSMQSLVAARVLQGLGGGGLMTLCFVILAQIFEPRERAKYQGWSIGAMSLAGFVGPVTGGIITQTIGWEYIFLLNLPVALGVIYVIVSTMPAIQKPSRVKIDYLGGALLAVMVICLTFGAEQIASQASSYLFYVLPIVFVMALIWFIAAEKRAAEPVLPLSFFNEGTIGLSLAISVLVGFCTLGLMTYFALFIQTVLGLPPAYAGLLFIPSTFGVMLASIAAGNLVAKTGYYKTLIVVAMVLGGAVLVLFAMIEASTPIWAIGIIMFAYPFAIGLQNQTLLIAVQNAAPKKDMGAATSSVNLARMIGASIGLAVNGGILNSGLRNGEANLPQGIVAQLPSNVTQLTPDVIATLPMPVATSVIDVFENAFGHVFYFCAGLYIVSFILAILLKNVHLPDDKAKP